MKTDSTVSKTQHRLSLFVAILALAFVLRGPLTGVGPLLQNIQTQLQISSTLAGMLTTVPLLTFGLFSIFIPRLAARLGSEQMVFFALWILTLGLVLRCGSGLFLLLTGTALLSCAIAVGNVLIPSMVKQYFPFKMGLVTALYALVMNMGGAAGSALSAPLAHSNLWGWRGALVIWVLPALVAMVIWWLPFKAANAVPKAAVRARQVKIHLWRNPLAWQVTLFMGFQSFLFYSTVSWLPQIVAKAGVSATEAGGWLGLMQLVMIPTNLLIPIYAARLKQQHWIGSMCGVALILSVLLLMSPWRSCYFPAVLLLGLGISGAFCLSMMFFSLRSSSVTEGVLLSGMAQTCGYLFAAVGPVLMGALHDMMHSWFPALCLMFIAAVVITVSGWNAGKDRKLSDFQE
ncbi:MULTISPECIES: MFS transporter [Snodgrassella]|uniref:CynX/NimT family MFS transporter n=1 Tax=Snodgrassella TaxID=1193515 RepID=UPI0009FC555D|nr:MULTISPECIES: MFS transporter [Snodgrassella]MBI0130188.1 MFS transporter [Snodgrassella sp. W8124]MBI0159170.1 MFS transporter [Snodgrassella sp. W6238H11]MBI0161356.1 MFS transporter [Snodgrassella sp. W6238H14]MBI0181177.1 MFS transporter [Snodgrassella sp. W8158]NUE81733.1 MFS transporter [Snodgrassella sp. ESL0304]